MLKVLRNFNFIRIPLITKLGKVQLLNLAK